MTERERLVRAAIQADANEMADYWQLVEVGERHQRREAEKEAAYAALAAYDAEHPEEIPVLPKVTLEDIA